MEKLKVGIIGAGCIAHTMAEALTAMPDAELVAVASRSAQKGRDFCARYGVARLYDTYEALVSDPEVELVYVATPHSLHAAHACLALEHDKPVLVEKPFAGNAREAEAVFQLARERGLYAGEAIWTRYMPMSHRVGELLAQGVIGTPRLLSATLCYNMIDKPRIWDPALCGGALLDVGVYTLHFARMYFGGDVVRTVSSAVIDPRGVDAQNAVSLTYADGRMANLQSGALTQNDRQGIICGTQGYLRLDNINCPEVIEVWRDTQLVERIDRPADMINGFEYQVRESKRCLEAGLLESPMAPHAETLAVMRQMDALRQEWGVLYPCDESPKN